jgi:hypothetical protein
MILVGAVTDYTYFEVSPLSFLVFTCRCNAFQ